MFVNLQLQPENKIEPIPALMSIKLMIWQVMGTIWSQLPPFSLALSTIKATARPKDSPRSLFVIHLNHKNKEFWSVIRQDPIRLRTPVRYPSKSVDVRVLRSVIPQNPLTSGYSGPLSLKIR
ncbi:uncharacterized protein EV154DRAFT_488151 [Mucor mucedo]|uniref:uncharacterized protein n=1 Tax=Mucor mucedo TaxID=29922 RepID=UPI002220DF8E|nr:uncharacterized protein EV154DRAFT_488151 [Mucor mucedo]KAI7868394.1 hypothetical protein EV154DRAFT_488151 [Mucor mucedo]